MGIRSHLFADEYISVQPLAVGYGDAIIYSVYIATTRLMSPAHRRPDVESVYTVLNQHVPTKKGRLNFIYKGQGRPYIIESMTFAYIKCE